MQLSINEKDVLNALWECDYRDGEYINCWALEIHRTCKVAKGKTISATVKHLKDKGLVTCEDEGELAVVIVTKSGIEAIKELRRTA